MMVILGVRFSSGPLNDPPYAKHGNKIEKPFRWKSEGLFHRVSFLI